MFLFDFYQFWFSLHLFPELLCLRKSYGKEESTVSAAIYYTYEYPDTTIINTADVVTAIRCQKNHYNTDVITTDTVDPDASDCYSCPFYQKGINCDRSCDKKHFIQNRFVPILMSAIVSGTKKSFLQLLSNSFCTFIFCARTNMGTYVLKSMKHPKSFPVPVVP